MTRMPKIVSTVESFNRCDQHRNLVTNILGSSPTLGRRHHDVTNITVGHNGVTIKCKIDMHDPKSTRPPEETGPCGMKDYFN